MVVSTKMWDEWASYGVPKYPHEKVVQFCFRNYPPEQRASIRALDLGCGSGVHTVFLATEGFQVTGTDSSEVGIAITREKLDTLGHRATLRVESADLLDLPPDSFDLVICVGVYEAAGLAVAKASVRKVRHVLTKGGRGLFLIATDTDYRVKGDNLYALHGFTRKEIEELFSQGFAKVFIDRYMTTYESGKFEQNDWLITLVG